ncbi:MAG: diaminopimelate decarboxylase, partial [Acidobacteria bacterium]|nr:diaminopimelate decarboxylase [Acidobacteriota bacterium]
MAPRSSSIGEQPSGSEELFCDDIPVRRLAARFGTPLYLYSASAIEARLVAFERAFLRVPHTICYSVKANSNLSILRLLRKFGCGFDVVSGGELKRVLQID